MLQFIPLISFKLNVNHYETILNPSRPHRLPVGFYDVGTDEDNEYIIGAILAGYLFPLMAPRLDLNNDYGKVKICTHGNNGNEIVPILNDDPLNRLFRRAFGSQHVLAADRLDTSG